MSDRLRAYEDYMFSTYGRSWNLRNEDFLVVAQAAYFEGYDQGRVVERIRALGSNRDDFTASHKLARANLASNVTNEHVEGICPCGQAHGGLVKADPDLDLLGSKLDAEMADPKLGNAPWHHKGEGSKSCMSEEWIAVAILLIGNLVAAIIIARLP